ncbi:MAG: hypothetical protein HRT38_14370 [Alteromonadaceae bacterium]|nr:hypothetical protein [Alteromonadaceae bacterium]
MNTNEIRNSIAKEALKILLPEITNLIKPMNISYESIVKDSVLIADLFIKELENSITDNTNNQAVT